MNETSFIFNKDTSINYESDEQWSLLYCRSQKRYLEDIYRTRGYIYLNQIYEQYGVKWNPEWANHCYIYEVNPVKIEISIMDFDEGFMITVTA